MPFGSTDQSDAPAGKLQSALKALSYPVSTILGVFYANSKVRNESYNNLRGMGAFDDLRAHRDRQAQNLLEASGIHPADHTRTMIDPQRAKQFSSGHAAIDAEYAEAINQRIADLGYTNMWKRYKALHFNQRLETGMRFFTVAGASLGVILTIANNKHLMDKLNERGDEADVTR